MDVLTLPAISNGGLDAFKIRDAALLALVEKNKNLTIKGLDDKAGYRLVDAGRIELKKARVSIENDRKALKEVALVYGRTVDKEAARLTMIVETEELRLKAMTDVIDAEKAAKVRAAEEERKALARQRQDEFRALNSWPPIGFEEMGQAEYDEALAAVRLAKVKADEELAAVARKQAEEAAILKAERERVEKQRAENERQRQEALRVLEVENAKRLAEEVRVKKEQDDREAVMRAEQDRVRAEQEQKAAELRAHEQRIKDQEAAQRRAVELEEAKRVAAERAVQEEKERAARAAEEQKRFEAERLAENARLAKEEAEAKAKAEAEKPMREKILDVARQVDSISVPSIGPVAVRIEKLLLKVSADIRKIAKEPLE